MSLSGKVAVVLGATGFVGQGVVADFLLNGATVVAVSRSLAKITPLREALQAAKVPLDRFEAVEGDFTDEKSAVAAKSALHTALGDRTIDHVVSNLGFVETSTAPTTAALSELQNTFNNSFYPHVIAAQKLLVDLKAREGATYTLVSGGLAHVNYSPHLWLGTVKSAAVNGLQLTLAKETEGDKVRVNTICIHFPVAPLGGDKNQWGSPGVPTLELGKAFTAVAAGNHKGKLLCVSGVDDIKKL